MDKYIMKRNKKRSNQPDSTGLNIALHQLHMKCNTFIKRNLQQVKKTMKKLKRKAKVPEKKLISNIRQDFFMFHSSKNKKQKFKSQLKNMIPQMPCFQAHKMRTCNMQNNQQKFYQNQSIQQLQKSFAKYTISQQKRQKKSNSNKSNNRRQGIIIQTSSGIKLSNISIITNQCSSISPNTSEMMRSKQKNFLLWKHTAYSPKNLTSISISSIAMLLVSVMIATLQRKQKKDLEMIIFVISVQYIQIYYMRKLKSDITLKSFTTDQFDYVSGQMQGWRPNMQDSHICGYQNVAKDLSLFAVFDGHGGGHVSKYVAEQFITIFKSTPQYQKGDYVGGLEKCFQILDKKLITPQGVAKLNILKNEQKSINQKANKQSEIPPAMLTGSTANVVLITNQQIIVANCGDSRSALYISTGCQSNFNNYIQLSQDHKPDCHQEKKRIQNAGGYVANGRTNANLSLSRAFGDYYYKLNEKFSHKEQVITCHPQITIYNRLKSRNKEGLNFLVIGCDGIWERFQDNSAGLLQFVRCDLVLELGIEKAMKNLLNLLVSKDPKDIIESKGKGCDNMTAIIIKFK